MSVVHCFTSASFAYFDRVRTLGQTLRQHHPDWVFWLCLVDEEPVGFHLDFGAEPIDRIMRIQDLGISNLQSWMFEHDVVELCTAVKGKMLHHLLEQDNVDKVVYLDPDIAVFSPLTEVIELLDSNSIVLTPHQLDPDTEISAIIDNEIGSMKFGIYNLGFVAVAGTDEGKRFAAWWRDRLLSFCFDDVPNGLFTDQRWCDHVPSFFSGVHILKHRGYNVASWNLSNRTLSIGRDGLVRASTDVLRFFHFTKVTWVGEIMLERYCRDRIEVFELMHWYRRKIEENKVTGLPGRWWAFDHYEDGSSISRSHRLKYRYYKRLQTDYPNPFVSGCVGGALAELLDKLDAPGV